jgi:hypothetical protein
VENCIHTTERLAVKAIGTCDFASPVELVKAIDLAMRHYFGAADWLSVRDRLFQKDNLNVKPFQNKQGGEDMPGAHEAIPKFIV